MLENVKQSLDTFAKQVVSRAKANLTKNKMNASKALHDSLGYELNVGPNSFSLKMLAEDYWIYQDKGVKGVGGTKADGTAWKVKKVFDSPFTFKTKMPPPSAFNGWVIRRGIAPRSVGGQFTSRKGLMFAIAKSVFHTGIKTTHFWSKPFEEAFKNLPKELVEAFALDVQDLIKFTTK